MTDQPPRPIPREAVDAAARQLHTGFDTAAPIEQYNARETAMEALTAALPLLLAVELERLAEATGQDFVHVDNLRWGASQAEFAVLVEEITDRATALRGEFRG